MRKLNINSPLQRQNKYTSQAKKVSPPAIPTNDMLQKKGKDFAEKSINYLVTNERVFRNNTTFEDEIFINSALKNQQIEEFLVNDENIFTDTNHSHQTTLIIPNNMTLLTHGQNKINESFTHKTAVFFHQQLSLQEDQGIDLTQSPGRDSPGSSSESAGSGSRYSTASLDSGRASSYHTAKNSGAFSSIRGGIMSSPRCSVSSCSIGSVDRISLRTDIEMITDWMIEIKFDEYIDLFICAGYDLPTISRMTPEDLTAIGIKNPQHREKIKRHIDNLKLPDNLPHFVPGSIEEWLELLRLEEYMKPLMEQNFKNVQDVTQLIWEDLEDIGIVKLGHQKKILLAIKRIKDIISGKWKSNVQWRRSYDDGDITPTNEFYLLSKTGKEFGLLNFIEESSDTIPTKSNENSGINSFFECRKTENFFQEKVKNVDVLENIKLECLNCSVINKIKACSDRKCLLKNSTETMNKNLTPDCFDKKESILLMPNFGYKTGKNSFNKKVAPEPPRRQCSISENEKSINLQEPSVVHFMKSTSKQSQSTFPSTQNEVPYFTIIEQNQDEVITMFEKLCIPSQVDQNLKQNNQPIYANYSNIHQTIAEIHNEQRSQESKNFHSNLSIDSIDTIPFANENTGTIKQRLLNRQDISSSASSSEPCSLTSTNPIKSTQTFHSCTSEIFREVNCDNIKLSNGTSNLCQSNKKDSIDENINTMNGREQNDPENVLSDIGDMLANLSDELDAMLEEEKRVGISDGE